MFSIFFPALVPDFFFKSKFFQIRHKLVSVFSSQNNCSHEQITIIKHQNKQLIDFQKKINLYDMLRVFNIDIQRKMTFV